MFVAVVLLGPVHGGHGTLHGFGMSLRFPRDGRVHARFSADAAAEVPDPVGFLRIATRTKLQIRSLLVEVEDFRELADVLLQVGQSFSGRRLPVEATDFQLRELGGQQPVLVAARLRILRDGRLVLDGECSVQTPLGRREFKKAILHPEKSGELILTLSGSDPTQSEQISVGPNH
jgi:hypothetical protein